MTNGKNASKRQTDGRTDGQADFEKQRLITMDEVTDRQRLGKLEKKELTMDKMSVVHTVHVLESRTMFRKDLTSIVLLSTRRILCLK